MALHPKIAELARRRLVVGPSLAQDVGIRERLWEDLLRDRKARAATEHPGDAA